MKDSTIGRLTLSHDGRGNRMFNVGYNMVGGIIPEDYQLRIKKFLDESKDNKLTDNSTVYVTPLSELPAYKLKNYIQENKLKITTARKFEKLDTLVLNKDFIERHYYNISIWNTNIKNHEINYTTDYLIFPVDVIIKDSGFKKYINPHNNRWSSITEKGRKKITHYCVSIDEYNNICTHIPYFKNVINKSTIVRGIILEGSHGSKKAFDGLEFYINLLDNVKKHNLKVVFDSNVNEDINKGLVIDFEIFQNLYGMLRSTDIENWEVAKEIIANCEFEASKAYIIALYNMFIDLHKTSANKNYNLVKKAIQAKKYGLYFGRNSYVPFESLLSHFAKVCPELLPQQLPCLVHHLNYIAKKEIIKEIVLA
jgi:hypothetical protein